MKDLEKCNIVDNNSKNPRCGALHVRQFFVSFVSLKGEVTAKRIGFGIRQTRIQCPGLQHVSRSLRGQPLELSKFPHLGERGPCPKSQWIWNGKTQSKLLKCTSSNVFILKSVSYKSQEQEMCVAFERLGSGDGKRVPWGGEQLLTLSDLLSMGLHGRSSLPLSAHLMQWLLPLSWQAFSFCPRAQGHHTPSTEGTSGWQLVSLSASHYFLQGNFVLSAPARGQC